jgi:hypothetical protein
MRFWLERILLVIANSISWVVTAVIVVVIAGFVMFTGGSVLIFVGSALKWMTIHPADAFFEALASAWDVVRWGIGWVVVIACLGSIIAITEKVFLLGRATAGRVIARFERR